MAEDCDDNDASIPTDADCDGIYDPALIASGSLHTCALNPEQDITCWGIDSYGQVSNTPTGSFTQVSTGEHHSCAIDTDGEIQCWGAGESNDNCSADLSSQVDCGQSSPPENFTVWDGM